MLTLFDSVMSSVAILILAILIGVACWAVYTWNTDRIADRAALTILKPTVLMQVGDKVIRHDPDSVYLGNAHWVIVTQDGETWAAPREVARVVPSDVVTTPSPPGAGPRMPERGER